MESKKIIQKERQLIGEDPRSNKARQKNKDELKKLCENNDVDFQRSNLLVCDRRKSVQLLNVGVVNSIKCFLKNDVPAASHRDEYEPGKFRMKPSNMQWVVIPDGWKVAVVVGAKLYTAEARVRDKVEYRFVGVNSEGKEENENIEKWFDRCCEAFKHVAPAKDARENGKLFFACHYHHPQSRLRDLIKFQYERGDFVVDQELNETVREWLELNTEGCGCSSDSSVSASSALVSPTASVESLSMKKRKSSKESNISLKSSSSSTFQESDQGILTKKPRVEQVEHLALLSAATVEFALDDVWLLKRIEEPYKLLKGTLKRFFHTFNPEKELSFSQKVYGYLEGEKNKKLDSAFIQDYRKNHKLDFREPNFDLLTNTLSSLGFAEAPYDASQTAAIICLTGSFCYDSKNDKKFLVWNVSVDDVQSIMDCEKVKTMTFFQFLETLKGIEGLARSSIEQFKKRAGMDQIENFIPQTFLEFFDKEVILQRIGGPDERYAKFISHQINMDLFNYFYHFAELSTDDLIGAITRLPRRVNMEEKWKVWHDLWKNTLRSMEPHYHSMHLQFQRANPTYQALPGHPAHLSHEVPPQLVHRQMHLQPHQDHHLTELQLMPSGIFSGAIQRGTPVYPPN